MLEDNEDINIQGLTWAALLNRWLDFARASVSFPDNLSGKRWKEAVAPIITLQSVTFALTEVNNLPHDERALGLDKATIIVYREMERLWDIWPDEPMHDLVLEIIEDAKLMLNSAVSGPIYELIIRGKMEDTGKQKIYEMPDISDLLLTLVSAGFSSSFYTAWPGTLLVEGEVAGYITCCGLANSEIICNLASSGESKSSGSSSSTADNIDLGVVARDTVLKLGDFILARRLHVNQIYRQVDKNGRIHKDIITMFWNDPIAGKPLFEPLISAGKLRIPDFDRTEWTLQQRRNWPENGLLEFIYQ